MSQLITPDVDILAEPPEADDGGTWDFDRGMATIRNLREENRQLRATSQRYKVAVGAMLGGREVPAGIIVSEPPAAPGADLAVVAAVLGADASDVASVVEAATQARLSGELYPVIAEAGADPILTRAMLNQSRALVSVDLSAADLHDQLQTIVADAVSAHPNLKVRRDYPSVSGVPFGAGSGGAPSHVSKDDLKWMSPEQISAARRAGLLTHLNVGSDK